MCSGVYKAHEAPTVRTEAPTVRSTGAPDHQPNTRSEGGDHPGTNTIINGGGHPYARHPPGYPRGRPGGVISPHTSPVKKTYRPHTVQSAVSPRFYRQGATKQSCATVPARVWLSQPLECIPNPKPNYLMVWRLERVGVLSPQSLGAHRHSCLKLTLPLKNKLTV